MPTRHIIERAKRLLRDSGESEHLDYGEALDIIRHVAEMEDEPMDLWRSVFGLTWNDIHEHHRTLIRNDVAALAETEFDGSLTDAAVELRRRIGGPRNLLSYAATLAAGQRMRERNI